jgi:hypothetical protein
MKQWIIVVLIVVAILAVCGVAVSALGWYPVAFVGATPIWAHDYTTNLSLATNYYSYYNQHSSNPVPQADLAGIIRKAALGNLIDAHIVDKELASHYGAQAFEKEIDTRIASTTSDADFMNNLETAFSASAKDITRYFIRDKIRYQMLDEELGALNPPQDGESWLEAQHKNLQVRIFLSGLVWKDGAVTDK